jgi:ATP-dependent DNA helicase RecG
MNYCLEAGIPAPNYFFEASDFLVEFRKDIYNEENLKSLGMNERQIKAVLFVKENGKITNKEYQELNNMIDRTARRDLAKLVELNILIKKGVLKGTYYEI